jgi:hypothetical protein
MRAVIFRAGRSVQRCMRQLGLSIFPCVPKWFIVADLHDASPGATAYGVSRLATERQQDAHRLWPALGLLMAQTGAVFSSIIVPLSATAFTELTYAWVPAAKCARWRQRPATG